MSGRHHATLATAAATLVTAVSLCLAPAAGAATSAPAIRAQAAVQQHRHRHRHHHLHRWDRRERVRAYRWAERQAGKPYAWSGTGPGGFDCSGLVMMAYRQIGVRLPRTTFEMLASHKLRRIPRSQARKGDLAFYGPGHVELVARSGRSTFGALDAGTVIGWHRVSVYWHPTFYMRVRGAGLKPA